MSNVHKDVTIDELHKEIDLIQGCINRMANNSFLIKGWLVSIVAVVVALAPDELNPFINVLTITLVTISFWYLDAFFLRTEKMYRKMYEWVLEARKQKKIEFQYDLNPYRFEFQVDSIFKVMFSKTLKWFYGIIILLIIIIIIYYSWPSIINLICRC